MRATAQSGFGSISCDGVPDLQEIRQVMGQIGKPQNAPRQYRAYILGHVKGAPFALLCQFVELFALDADAGQHLSLIHI